MTGNIWTVEMIKSFRKLHGDKRNLSFSDIAIKLSEEFKIELTRNACIGKARRIGLPMRDNTPRTAVERKRIRTRIDAPIPVELPPRRPVEETAGLTIYETREGDCKWPLGKVEDYPPYAYCGHPAPIGAPYCKAHSKMAYNTPRVTWT